MKTKSNEKMTGQLGKAMMKRVRTKEYMALADIRRAVEEALEDDHLNPQLKNVSLSANKEAFSVLLKGQVFLSTISKISQKVARFGSVIIESKEYGDLELFTARRPINEN